jgi:hypothetical protein
MFQFKAAIMLESDVQVSKDFYAFMKWSYQQVFAKNYELNPQVLTISSSNLASRPEIANTLDKYELRPASHTTYGWMISAPMYNFLNHSYLFFLGGKKPVIRGVYWECGTFG